MDTTDYRKLTAREIQTLESNGCFAEEWNRIEVTEAFTPDGIARCRFAGTVRLGKNVRIDTVHEPI